MDEAVLTTFLVLLHDDLEAETRALAEHAEVVAVDRHAETDGYCWVGREICHLRSFSGRDR